MTKESDGILAIWLIGAILYDFAVIAATGYLVFWRGHSGWWFVLAIILCQQPTLIKALRKRFSLPDEDSK